MNRYAKPLWVICFVMFSISGAAAGAQKNAPSPSPRPDPPRVVANPAKPSQGVIAVQLEEIRRFRSSDVPGGAAAFHIVAPAGDALLAGDFTSHRVYAFQQSAPAAPAFVFLRKGEGPGEIPFGAFSAAWRANALWVGAPRKIIRFSPRGEFRDEWKLPQNFRKIRVIGENLFIGNHPDKQGVYSCSLCDFTGTEKTCFMKLPNGGVTTIQTQVNGQEVRVNFSASAVTPDILHALTPDGKEAMICKTTEYVIYRYSPEGAPKMRISREHTPVTLSEADKKELVGLYFSREIPPVRQAVFAHLPDRLCVVSDIRVLPNGCLAVARLTSLKHYETDLFDETGVYIRRLQFREAEGKTYFLMENGRAGMLETTDDGDVFTEYRIVNVPGFREL